MCTPEKKCEVHIVYEAFNDIGERVLNKFFKTPEIEALAKDNTVFKAGLVNLKDQLKAVQHAFGLMMSAAEDTITKTPLTEQEAKLKAFDDAEKSKIVDLSAFKAKKEQNH